MYIVRVELSWVELRCARDNCHRPLRESRMIIYWACTTKHIQTSLALSDYNYSSHTRVAATASDVCNIFTNSRIFDRISQVSVASLRRDSYVCLCVLVHVPQHTTSKRNAHASFTHCLWSEMRACARLFACCGLWRNTADTVMHIYTHVRTHVRTQRAGRHIQQPNNIEILVCPTRLTHMLETRVCVYNCYQQVCCFFQLGKVIAVQRTFVIATANLAIAKRTKRSACAFASIASSIEQAVASNMMLHMLCWTSVPREEKISRRHRACDDCQKWLRSQRGKIDNPSEHMLARMRTLLGS